MKPKVYIETSIVSYLTAWPSRDLVVAAHQEITREWWGDREQFEPLTSDVVLAEAARGDGAAAALRLEMLEDIPVLSPKSEDYQLAKRLVSSGPLPDKASTDALHISISAIHGIDYLLTWNCAHIANPVLRDQVYAICHESGSKPPMLCTPEELLAVTS